MYESLKSIGDLAVRIAHHNQYAPDEIPHRLSDLLSEVRESFGLWDFPLVGLGDKAVGSRNSRF